MMDEASCPVAVDPYRCSNRIPSSVAVAIPFAVRLNPASDTLTQKSTLVELIATYESVSERNGN